MRLRRWRSGERVALAGLVLLLASLPLRWFSLSADGACRAFGGGVDGEGRCAALSVAEGLELASGWGSLGVGWALLLGALALLVASMLLLTLRVGPRDPTASVVTLLVLCAAATATVLPALLLRVLWWRPDLGLRTPSGDPLPGDALALAAGGWLGLLGLVLLAYGMWRAMADERRAAPDSAVDAVPVRAAPAVAGRPPVGPRA